MKQNTFSMRVFSVLLCLALLCTFAPLTSIAASDTKVFVGGVQVTSENAADVLGDGSVSYDASTTTLTLDGAIITDTYDYEDAAVGIFAEADLIVNVKGANYMNLSKAAGYYAVAGIYADGDLTVCGDGDLTVITPNASYLSGAIVCEDTLDYEIAGICNLTAGAANKSYALAGFTAITFNCATTFSATTQTAVFNQMPTLRNPVALIDAYVSTSLRNDIPSLPLTADNAEDLLPNVYKMTIEGQEPFCYVAGVPVTVNNASDVFGDGTVWYDIEKEELVLNNANLTDINFDYDEAEDVSVIYGSGDLTIRVIGDNVLDASAYVPVNNPTPEYNQGLYISGTATFVGDGNLTAIGGYAVNNGSYGIYCQKLNVYGAGDYSFIGTEVADDGATSYGIYVSGYSPLSISGTKYVENESHGVFAMGESFALSCYGVNVDSTVYEQYYSNENDESALEVVEPSTDLSAAKRLFWKATAVTEYDVMVNGVQVNANNMLDVLEDGTVSYDLNKNMVTLSDATLTVAATGCDDEADIAALFFGENTDGTAYVYLEGDNVIDLTTFTPDEKVDYLQGIEVSHNLTICGPGSLTIVSDTQTGVDLYGIYCDGTVTIENKGGFTVDLPQTSDYVCGVCGYTLYLDVPYISVKAEYALSASNVYKPGDVDCFATETVGGTLRNVNTQLDSSDYVEVQTKVAEFKVWVGDTQVTTKNYFDVLGDGTVSYNPDSNGLFLRDAHITGGIRCTMAEDFGVILMGNNSISVTGDDESALYAPYLYVVGDGTLEINMDCSGEVYGIKGEEVYLENSNDISIEIEDGADIVQGGVYAEDYLEFSGDGNVDVSVGRTLEWTFGIYCNVGIQHNGFGSLTVTADGSDGDVYGIYCDGDLESSGYGVISAFAGEAQGDSIGAEILGVLNIANERMSSANYYFRGKTQAIETTGTPDIGDYTLRASKSETGDSLVLSPSLASLEEYKRVWFNPPYTVNSVDDIRVENDSSVSVDWSFSNEPDYAYVLADVYDNGEYEDLVGGGAYVSDSSFTTTTDEYNTSTHKWIIAACYGGDMDEMGTTVIFSEPFTVTYYEMVSEVWFDVEPPQIGMTPSQWYDGNLVSYCKEEPTVAWFDLTEDSDGVLLAPGEVFKVGHSYGAELRLRLEDYYEVATDAEVEADHGTAVGTPWFDGDVTSFGTVFNELVETVSGMVFDFERYPEDGLTPGDINFTKQTWLSSGISVNVFSDVSYTWKYNENTSYIDLETAKTLANDAPFVGGNSYVLEAKFVLKDGFVPNPEAFDFFCDGGTYGWGLDSLMYDETTRTITFYCYWGRMMKSISSVDLLLDVPEIGLKPTDLDCMIKDASIRYEYDNYYISWYKVDAGSYIPIADDTEFEKDTAYAAQIYYDLYGYCELAPNLTATVNGKEEEVTLYDYDTFEVFTEFEPLSDNATPVEAFDVTALSPIVGRTVEEAMSYVSIDSDVMEYFEVSYYLYNGIDSYIPLSLTDVFEEGQTYGVQVDFSLASGYVASEDPKLADGITVNGEAPSAPGIPNAAETKMKSGFVCWATEAIPAPEITLTAPETTEFTIGDEALSSVQCGVAYNFEPEFDGMIKNVLVNVLDKDDMVVYSSSSGAAYDVVMVDLSGDSVTAGTYKVTVAAYFRDEKVVSNVVELVVKAKETTTEAEPTTTGTETEPTATGTETEPTATGTVTEPSSSESEPTATGTETEPSSSETEPTATGTETEPSSSESEPTATGTETEPSSSETEPTATGTVTEPSSSKTEPSSSKTEPTVTGTEIEPTTTGTQTDIVMLGDANNDGAVNMKDVLTLRKQIAGMDVTFNVTNADVNEDGDVNMKDVLMLRKYLADLIETLGA